METTAIVWGITLFAGAVLCYFMFGRPHDVRRKRFINREASEFEDWFAKYYERSEVTRAAVSGVLDALSFEVECSPTQLLPTDRIDHELSCHPKCGDSFELADNSLQQFLRNNGITQPLDNSGWDTIDDVIRAVDAAIKSARGADVRANVARRGQPHGAP